ncbi:MAG: hypothetical protein U9Q62_08345 [Campylobacterota bacterium]|nr:hypothetical protein [Campylobacterota bacterium]
MKYVLIFLTFGLLLFSGCSQKEFTDGVNDMGDDISNVVKGKN